MSVREQIIDILKRSSRPLTVTEIVNLLNLQVESESEIYDHLEHIAKTVWRSSGGKLRLYMVPPICKSCGYVFKELRKLRKPSRCPKCKGQRIDPPKFIIDEA